MDLISAKKLSILSYGKPAPLNTFVACLYLLQPLLRCDSNNCSLYEDLNAFTIDCQALVICWMICISRLKGLPPGPGGPCSRRDSLGVTRCT